MGTFDRIRIASAVALAVLCGTANSYTPPNSVASSLDKFRSFSELTSAAGSMDMDAYVSNLTTWQMPHGGFSKAHADLYKSPWDGKADLSSWSSDGVALGMFDNNATVQEMRLLATQYKATKDAAKKTLFKNAFTKAVGFVLASALPNGGWPQVYPKRTGTTYSNMATYNDNAMTRVMVMVKDMVDKKAPFDSDILSSSDLAKLSAALDKAVTFALKAQIVNGGKPTVWCAQHDPSTYAPVGARAYELPSKSGSESIGVTYFLMNWPNQTTEVQKAVKGSIAWYKKNRVADLKFSNGDFVATPGASMWYRFYEVETDDFFFCDRDGASTKTNDITKISAERRTGYQWGGDYGSALLKLESDYINALPPVSIGVETAQRGIRLQGNRILAALSQDGLYQVQVLDARGVVRTSVAARTVEGTLDVAVPAMSGTGVGFVRLVHEGRTLLVQSFAHL